MSLPKLSIIINHFNPTSNDRLEAMVIFVLECFKAYTENSHELLLSDGSGISSLLLSKKTEELGYQYIASSEKLSFSETYNRGLMSANGSYIVLCANDIFVCPSWDTRMIEEIDRTSAWMSQPYLSFSDYPCQNIDFPFKKYTYVSSAMTFNLNMMTKSCLNKIGLLNDDFSGCYNDSDYLIRIRKNGGKVITCDIGRVTHLGRATTSTSGASSVEFEKDRITFGQKYPKYSQKVGFSWHDIRNPLFSKSLIFRSGINLISRLRPRFIRNQLLQIIYRLEPLLHRI